MGWSIGFDDSWNRDIGYGVPCLCDHPKCRREIDRGLAFVCGGDVRGGEYGCGLFFCSSHLYLPGGGRGQLCKKCVDYRSSRYKPKRDIRVWLRHKLRHHSWKQWRKENPTQVLEMKRLVVTPHLKGRRNARK